MPRINNIGSYYAAIACIDAVELFEQYGIEYTLKGNEIIFRCINPEHEDSNPSCGMDATTKLWSCWSCGVSGGLAAFVGRVKRVPYHEAMRLIEQGLNADIVQLVADRLINTRQQLTDAQDPYLANQLPEEYVNLRIAQNQNIVTYLQGRGITIETMHEYDVGYAVDGQYAHNVIVPIYMGGMQVSFVARNIWHKQYLYPKNFMLKRTVYNCDAIDDGGKVIVVESILDVLRLHSLGIGPACAIMSNRLYPQQARTLMRAGEIIFMPDRDNKHGMVMVQTGMKHLLHSGSHLTVAVVPVGKDPGDCTGTEIIDAVKGRVDAVDMVVRDTLPNKKGDKTWDLVRGQ